MIRVVAITGTPTASRTLPASAAIVSWLTGAGGATILLRHTPRIEAEAGARTALAQDYTAAVADVVARIAAGELFQANIARAWGGAAGG